MGVGVQNPPESLGERAVPADSGWLNHSGCHRGMPQPTFPPQTGVRQASPSKLPKHVPAGPSTKPEPGGALRSNNQITGGPGGKGHQGPHGCSTLETLWDKTPDFFNITAARGEERGTDQERLKRHRRNFRSADIFSTGLNQINKIESNCVKKMFLNRTNG